MADGLYDRYMAAAKDYRVHTRTCAACTPRSHCAEGARLGKVLGALQDAYIKRLRRS